jgi:hypothetical protein
LALLRFAAHPRVLAIDLEQELAVGVRRRGRLADAFALGKRYRVPALVGDLARQFLVDIQGQHRNPVQARELEQGQIQFWRRVPDLFPLRLARNSLTLSSPATQRSSTGCSRRGKHFEADDHFRAQRVQPGEHLQLPLVVVGVVMLFAEQQHLASDQFGQDLLLADRLRLLIGRRPPSWPAPDRLGPGLLRRLLRCCRRPVRRAGCCRMPQAGEARTSIADRSGQRNC